MNNLISEETLKEALKKVSALQDHVPEEFKRTRDFLVKVEKYYLEHNSINKTHWAIICKMEKKMLAGDYHQEVLEKKKQEYKAARSDKELSNAVLLSKIEELHTMIVDLKANSLSVSKDATPRKERKPQINLKKLITEMMQDGKMWNFAQVHEELIAAGYDAKLNTVCTTMAKMKKESAGKIVRPSSGTYRLKKDQ